jgi:hypothetical protein
MQKDLSSKNRMVFVRFDLIWNLFNDLKHIVVLIAAIIFLLITIFITIRQVKRLPLSYTVQILGNQEEKIMLPDLGLHFRR